MAEWSCDRAAFRTVKSTLSLGKYRYLSPSTFSNPHSSRNSMPPFSLPTLSCWRSQESRALAVELGEAVGFWLYLEVEVTESNFPELLLLWILDNIPYVDSKSGESFLNSNTIILPYQMHIHDPCVMNGGHKTIAFKWWQYDPCVTLWFFLRERKQSLMRSALAVGFTCVDPCIAQNTKLDTKFQFSYFKLT